MNDTTISVDEVLEPSVKQGIAILAVYTTVGFATACASAYIVKKLEQRYDRRNKIAPIITIA